MQYENRVLRTAIIRPEVTYMSIMPPRRGNADMICSACVQTVYQHYRPYTFTGRIPTQEAVLFLEGASKAKKKKKGTGIAP